MPGQGGGVKKKVKGAMDKVRARTQAGWLLGNGALQGGPVWALDAAACELHRRLVSLRWNPKQCLSRKGGKKRLSMARWQSHTAYLSPSSDLSMFSCLSKRDKRYDCSGMKTRVTFKQRKAETAV